MVFTIEILRRKRKGAYISVNMARLCLGLFAITNRIYGPFEVRLKAEAVPGTFLLSQSRLRTFGPSDLSAGQLGPSAYIMQHIRILSIHRHTILKRSFDPHAATWLCASIERSTASNACETAGTWGGQNIAGPQNGFSTDDFAKSRQI